MKKADKNELARISIPLDFKSKEKHVEGDESVEFQLARDKNRSFDPKRWIQALEQKRGMSLPGKVDHDPGIVGFRKLDPKLGAIFLTEKSTKVDVAKVKNPSPKASFGFAGNAIEIKGNGRHLTGTLVISLDKKIANRVGLETVKLFRWNSQANRFDKLERSGVSPKHEYVWGRITQSGIYVAIGFPSHPLVAQTARLFCAAGDVMLAAPAALRDRIRDTICQYILCAPDMAGAMKDERFARDLEELGNMRGYPTPSPDWAAGGDGVNWCELCLGVPGPSLPECELIPLPGGGPACTDTGWINVGPRNVGGCALQVAVDPNEPNRIFAASSDGGVWRLDDVSRYPISSAWVPLTDQEDTLATRALAISEFDSRIIYYADGLERLMRSDDRGAHWRSTATGLGNIRRILVHPSDPDTVFIASSSGFQGSADGGVHWDILRAGDALDAAMDVDDSSVLFVGIRNEGLYKSYTSGARWRLMLSWAQAVAPANTMIKIALGAQGTESRRMVAVRFADEVITNQRGGRPSDVAGGGPWMSRGNVGFSQADWDHVIAIDPFNDNVILSGGTQLFRTSDGGATSPWTRVIDYYGPHEDQQGLAFDPVNPNIVYVANDGGIYRSSDDGVTWVITRPTYDQALEIREKRDLNSGLVTAQFYRVGVSGNRAVGNLYHSGIIGTNVLNTSVWEGLEGHGWEFASVYGDPKRPGTFYVFGSLDVFRRLYPTPAGPPPLHRITSREPPESRIAPACIAVDETAGSGILLIGASSPGRIMRTADADLMTFVLDGGDPVTPMAWQADNGINLPGETIRAIECTPSMLRKAYAASDTGRTFTKEDISAADAWQERTNCGIGDVRELAVSSGNVDRLYAINGDTVRLSEDGGQGWITRNGTGIDTLPASEFNSIVTHPADPETVFLGADIGVFISTDEGRHWQPFDVGLPNAQLLQIYWRNGWLYAITYGRGLWRRQPCL